MGEKRTGTRRTASTRWLSRTVGVGVVAAVCIGAGAGVAGRAGCDEVPGRGNGCGTGGCWAERTLS